MVCERVVTLLYLLIKIIIAVAFTLVIMSCEYKVAMVSNREIANKNESYIIRINDEKFTKILHDKYLYFIDLSLGYKLFIIMEIFDIINFILTRKSIIVILTSFLFSILQCKRFYQN
ncbi:hypothetical protein HZS_6880 [Henneguya salminicola]|nr:hypothetical protein HZS_6880 [Henneguya salminicola]